MSLLADFLDGAPSGTAASLAALACAECLTDEVALSIYEKVPVPGLSAEDFVFAFKYSGLTEPRNSEWSLTPALRQELVGSKVLSLDAKVCVHQYLLALGQNEANRKKAGSEVPSYLFTEAGKAYHFAGAGDVEVALAHYGYASKGAFSGAQWLGAKLAEEQERTKVIPEGQIETTFLRAWVIMREGRKGDAMPLFRKIASTDREMREVAISLHIIGNENGRGQRRDAERELLRSIEIDRKLGEEFGVAQTLHSLANLLSKQEGRFKDAEEDYKTSIEIGRKLGNEYHVAQTLHSLANLLSKQEGRFKDAEEDYKTSIEIDRKLGNEFGVAQTLHSLANLLSKQEGRFKDAEEDYKTSIEIGRKLGNEYHVAQTLHSLANLLSKQEGRFKDAEEDYKTSIEIDRKLGNEFGVAQTLHSLANLLSKQESRFKDAEKFYQDSLALGEKLRNDNHIAQVLRSYALVVETRSPDEALMLLQRSLDINRRRGNHRFVRLVEQTMRQLRERAAALQSGGSASG